jgi:hypothetical protein
MFFSQGRSCWYCLTQQCESAFEARQKDPARPANHKLGPVWRAGGDILLTTTFNLKNWTTPMPVRR